MIAVAYVLGYLLAHPVYLFVFGALAVACVAALALFLRLTGPEGRHTLAEDAATAWLAELQYGTEAPAAAQRHPPALAPPPVHHDEFRPAQRWHREPVTVTRVPLPPVTGHALAVLAPLIAHLARHAEAEAAAWQAEVLAPFEPWEKWPGDDTLTSMRAIKAEVA